MFSQRNNPYCDSLKISFAKIHFFFEITSFFEFFSQRELIGVNVYWL